MYFRLERRLSFWVCYVSSCYLRCWIYVRCSYISSLCDSNLNSYYLMLSLSMSEDILLSSSLSLFTLFSSYSSLLILLIRSAVCSSSLSCLCFSSNYDLSLSTSLW